MRQPIVSGALRAMGLQLEQMSSEANEARELKSKIAAGDHVVSLDPGLFDPSFISDRISIEDDPGSTPSLQASPSVDNRFRSLPVRIPRRRSLSSRLWTPAAEGRCPPGYPVRAIIRAMTDVELVIAQTKENLDRQDLSYIERALLARQLEDRQFERAIVMSALGVDKADLSRLLSLAGALPIELVRGDRASPEDWPPSLASARRTSQ